MNVLVGIMGQTDAPPAARVAAANSVLDRGWGKPIQAIAGPDGDDGFPTSIMINVIKPRS